MKNMGGRTKLQIAVGESTDSKDSTHISKKQRILNLFDQHEWLGDKGSRFKIITYEAFREARLGSTIEYGEKHCDVIYARRIIQSLGHRVLVGMGFNVFEHGKIV